MVFVDGLKEDIIDIFIRTKDHTKSFKIKNHDFYNEADKIVKNYQEVSTTPPADLSSKHFL